jgi:hypothetical protein
MMNNPAKKTFITLSLCAACSWVLPVSAAYSVRDHVAVDWQKGEITATAFYSGQQNESGAPIDFAASEMTPTSARMYAYSMARESAALLIADALKNVYVENKISLQSLLESDADTSRKIGEIIPGKLLTKNTPEGFVSARCDARLRFSDIIAAISYEYPTQPFPELKENPLASEYTSLIIDARGENIRPVLFPSVVDQNGLEIYGKRYIEPSSVLKRGAVAYCTNEKEARIHSQAGDRPYFARAIGSVSGNCILSSRDTRKVLGHKKTVEKLKQCHVIIIIDPIRKESERVKR